MNRKTIVLVLVISAIFIVISYNVVNNVIEKKEFENSCNKAYTDLFVTDRARVIELYEGFGRAVKDPNEEQYAKLLETAAATETVCVQTFGQNSDLAGAYGAGLVYYGTFYRDIKSQLSKKCGTEVLQGIYDLLGEITALYNYDTDITDPNEQLRAVSEFYRSISLLNEDMMRFC
ncbi:MAG: hypothetical protein K2N36_07135 [Ruminiclostridium sp.]|nr:hypothetical protein [Ruminiclostridium sp.]